ncbi:hypothetical protein FA95DRAFT_1683382 [Auriscalpium vulgare]|uniref:Uncharacterized protein n=1 Tax=Auriscalpium vulgare TaxID=40419 RepID=A0ACB8RBF6_9AGAM|nr:hypothetical protein FA95DRAFT_1683382 [Auriscalpium vulgare]
MSMNLLQSAGDEDADGRTLDGILHGQSVIGKTAKTSEVDALRFTDRDSPSWARWSTGSLL